MCAVGVSSWRKVSGTMLYAVVEIPRRRDFIQKDKRVRSFFGQEHRRNRSFFIQKDIRDRFFFLDKSTEIGRAHV